MVIQVALTANYGTALQQMNACIASWTKRGEAGLRQAKQLNATLQLIDPEHYDDVLDVL